MIRSPKFLFPVLVAIFMLFGLVGCASLGGQRHVVTVSLVTSHGILALVQDSEKAMVCGVATAPVPCVTASAHKTISADLVIAWADEADVERLVRAIPTGAAASAEVSTLLGTISGLVDKILAAIPNSALKAALVTNLTGK